MTTLMRGLLSKKMHKYYKQSQIFIQKRWAQMFTEIEKDYLKRLVKKDLERFKSEEKDIISDMSPTFLKGEKEYGAFLKDLLKKLGK